MSIVISLTKLPDGVANTKSTHTFAQQGGTIGRGSDNDWIIEDDECFISSKHSQISFENGQYYLTDLSTNGTFANGAAEPIGKGNMLKLNDGDKFSLGDYEFLVSAWQAEAVSSAAINQGPFSDSTPPFQQPVVEQEKINSIQASNFSFEQNTLDDSFASSVPGHVAGTEALFSPDPVQTDPLAALDNARHLPEMGAFDTHSFSTTTHSDQADPMQHSVNWPEAKVETGVIPEDWESDIFGNDNKTHATNEIPFEASPEPVASVDKKSALEKANEKILAEIEILKKQAQRQALKEQIAKNTQAQKVDDNDGQQTTPINRSASYNEESLISILGLDAHNLSDEKVIEINQVVGEIVRETISGMMQVLSSRSTIKNEFRMNVTTIQPVENNPLKFSANVDDAIENMFVKDGNSYKKPVEAIKEGFEGIAEHQVAILAGIRTAFKGVLNRFDPNVLEQRFDKFNKPGLIPGMKNGKNWEAYTHYYNELIDDMDNSFQHLFGYEFVQAYEEQLQKLSIARKTSK